GIACTPARAEMAIAPTDPMNVTKMIAFWFSPNHRIASGSQVMLGSDCSPSTRLPRVSSTYLLVPQAMPMIRPTAMEIAYPVNRRHDKATSVIALHLARWHNYLPLPGQHICHAEVRPAPAPRGRLQHASQDCADAVAEWRSRF